MLALCFHPTSSITRNKNRACVIVEHTLDRDLLHLACHYLEPVAEASFRKAMPTISALEVLFSICFKEKYGSIV